MRCNLRPVLQARRSRPGSRPILRIRWRLRGAHLNRPALPGRVVCFFQENFIQCPPLETLSWSLGTRPAARASSRSRGANPTRLANRLVRDAVLRPLAPGLYVHPKAGRFGPVPPMTEELLRGFLQDGAFVVTGPEKWNALGLGTAAVLPVTLVWARSDRASSSSATVAFCSGAWRSRRIRPRSGSLSTSSSTRRWLGHRVRISKAALARSVASHRLGREALLGAASRYGTRATRKLVERAIAPSVTVGAATPTTPKGFPDLLRIVAHERRITEGSFSGFLLGLRV